mgnify:CR=1 FL=1
MIRVAIPNYESDERPDPHWWNNFYDELSHTTAIPFSGNVNEYHELLTDQANDILKEYAARGTYIYPVRQSMRLITDIFEWCSKELPKWNTISITFISANIIWVFNVLFVRLWRASIILSVEGWH